MTTPRTQHTPKKSPRKTPTAKSTPDAIAMLEADHRKVEALFSEYEKSKQKDKRSQVVDTICRELSLHAALEEAAFYPVVKDALGDESDLVDEAQVEHASLKWLIHQLQTEPANTELYAAKVTVLKEYVNHHVKEEEKELFPKVKKSGIDTVELGESMQAAKADLQHKFKLN
jgi:hemerythrin superfamily protein